MSFNISELLWMVFGTGRQELIITILCIIGIAAALAFCFTGFSRIRAWEILSGIIAGAVGGFYLGEWLGPILSSIVAKALIIIGAASIGGALASYFFTPAELLMCAFLAFGCSWSVLLTIFKDQYQLLFIIIAAVTGLLCGAAAYFRERAAVIVISSVCGAYSAWISAIRLLNLNTNPFLYWGIAAGIALLGVIIQFVATKKL